MFAVFILVHFCRFRSISVDFGTLLELNILMNSWWEVSPNSFKYVNYSHGKIYFLFLPAISYSMWNFVTDVTRMIAYFMFQSSATLFYDPEKKTKLWIFDDLSLHIFPSFASARMRFIFVTRCPGNKALFSFGLILNNAV